MIYLKEINKKDVTDSYVNWMSDLEVHQYTEQKYKKTYKLVVIKITKAQK